MDSLRIAAINAGSWITTLISMEFVKDFLQIAALCGSVAVSAASIWWINRQAKALAKRDAERK